MRVSLAGAGPRARLMEGTGTRPTCCPRALLPHTHTLEPRHVNACLFFHRDSRDDQARRTPHRAGPHRRVPSAAEKAPLVRLLSPGLPQRQLQRVWLQSHLPGLLRARPQARSHDKSGKTLYQPQIHLLPFQIWSVAHRGSHPSLVSPWAQSTLAASTRIRDWGYPQQRKCDCCSRGKGMGQTSF